MSTVTHIHDPFASPTLRAAALDLHRPADGIVAAIARPGTRRDAGMFGTLLQAIGKNTTNSSAVLERGPNNAAIYTAAWLDAHAIATVVLIDANVALPPQIQSVAETVAAVGADLVILTDGNLTARHRKAISSWASPALDETDGATFVQALAAQAKRPVPAVPVPEPDQTTTEVPATDFLTFRADARDLLPPAAFAAVDDLYRSTFTAFQPESPKQTDIANEIHRLVTQTLDPGQQTVIIRAIQAKAFTDGYHVEVDLPGLLAAVGPAAAVRLLSPSQWTVVGSSMRPLHGTIAALTAAGLTPEEMLTLPRSAVHPSGRSVAADGQQLLIPEPAVAIVRAQHVVHQLCHFNPGDPLLWDTARVQLRDIGGALNDITRQHGIKIRSRFSRNFSTHWQHRWGLKLLSLGVAS